MFSYYYRQVESAVEHTAELVTAAQGLSPQTAEHLTYLTAKARQFAGFCRDLSLAYKDSSELFARQHLHIQVSRIANELLTMSLVLARAHRLSGQGYSGADHLAHTYCARARNHIEQLWREASGHSEVDYKKLSNRWIQTRDLDYLLQDTVIDTSQVASM